MYLIRQGSRVCINTPAKLNLFLELHRRRGDGFHDLETLMVPISLFDTLTITAKSAPEINLDCRWVHGLPNHQCAALPPSHENIVVRALKLLKNVADVREGADLQLAKRIPAQAGLGGGSSDAAAALIGANQVWQLGWSLEALAELGSEIGSDVPFFLFDSARYGSPLVRCTGRGEIMRSAPMSGRLPCVVVKPDFGLSTPDVFAQVSVPEQHQRCDTLLNCLLQRDFRSLANGMFNRLQQAAARLTPWIDEIAKCMSDLSVWGHQLSGSGTSYFAVCRSIRHARHVSARLRAQQLGRTFVVTTLGPRLAH